MLELGYITTDFRVGRGSKTRMYHTRTVVENMTSIF